jgi:TolA-binding protein
VRGRVDEPAAPAKAAAGGRRERDRDELGEVEALAIRGSCRRAAEQAARLRSGSGAGLRAEARMMVADCHHAAGQLETALELYREVATDYARTAAGQNAAYEAARLAQKLGKTEEARRAFEAFARHNRGHPLAAEALFRVCVADATTERTEAALQCLRLFRQRYPRHRRRAESFLLEATLLRTEAHDCAGAIAAYDAYLEQPGELEEQARQWRAWCVEELRRQSP